MLVSFWGGRGGRRGEEGGKKGGCGGRGKRGDVGGREGVEKTIGNCAGVGTGGRAFFFIAMKKK